MWLRAGLSGGLKILCMYHAGVQLGAFLAAAKLAAQAKLSEADKNASMGTKAEAGDGAKLAKADTAVSSTPTIVVVPGIPALPKNLAQKMLNGEYVDFAELPPAKGRAKPSSLDWEGKVLLVQSTDLYATKKLIPDLATWVQCFSIYAAVLWSQSPQRLPDLLGYAAFIAKCNQKFKWPSYSVMCAVIVRKSTRSLSARNHCQRSKSEVLLDYVSRTASYGHAHLCIFIITCMCLIA